MKPSDLVLRDVHLPPAPSWWPPAPGWWLLAGALLALALLLWGLGWRRRGRRRRWAAWFDTHCAAQASAAQVAAISELLRRAARRVDPQADRLQGEDWLRFLDGGQGAAFTQGPGRLLLEGGFRPRVDDAALAGLRGVARSRFLQLMAGRR